MLFGPFLELQMGLCGRIIFKSTKTGKLIKKGGGSIRYFGLFDRGWKWFYTQSSEEEK